MSTIQRSTSARPSACSRRRREAGRRLALLLILTASGLGCGSSEGEDFLGCPMGVARDGTFEIMREVYLYNDLPDQWRKYSVRGPSEYSDPDAMLDFLRYRPELFDRDFSTIETVEQDEAFNRGDEFYMFGLIFARPSGGAIGVNAVVPGSPADLSGLERGDQVSAIDGRSVSAILAAEGIDAALGFYAPGTSRTFTVERIAGGVDDIPLTTALVELPTLIPPPSDGPFVFDLGGGRVVGYVSILLFIEPTVRQLDLAFSDLRAQGVTDLVVDLRYSPGGLVLVAEYLNSLLGGARNAGRVQFVLRANSANAFANETFRFSDLPNSIDLERIAFITTEETASAAELVINALAASNGIEVAVIGSRSFGKPVGSAAFDFCEDLLRVRPIAFEVVNADGFGRYYEGLEVDCPAVDDNTRPLGDPQEASLGAALHWIELGECPLTASAAGALGESPEMQRARSRADARSWLRSRSSL